MDTVTMTDLLLFDGSWTFLSRGSNQEVEPLLSFQRAALDSSLPGAAWLAEGVYTDATTQLSIEDPHIVLNRIRDLVAAARDLDDLLPARHILVISAPRLIALLKRFDDDRARDLNRGLARYADRQLYITIQTDFAGVGGSRLLYLMFCMSDVWPLPHLPPPGTGDAPSPALPLSDAGRRLEFLFSEVQSALRFLLLESFQLQTANLVMAGRQISPPSLYSGLLQTGDASLRYDTCGEEPWRDALSRISSRHLHAGSLEHDSVAVSGLGRGESELLVVRREMIQDSGEATGMVYPTYLALPLEGGTRTERLTAIWRLVDQLGYIELIVAQSFHVVLGQFDREHARVSAFRYVSDSAHDVMDSLLWRLSTERGRALDALHEAMTLMHSTMLQGEGDIGQTVLDLNERNDGLAIQLDDAKEQLRLRFDERPFGNATRISDAICESWYTRTASLRHGILNKAERARDGYEMVLEGLRRVFEQRRVREVETLEAMSMRLNVILALLAAVLAFEALVRLELAAPPQVVVWVLRLVTGIVAAAAVGLGGWAVVLSVRNRGVLSPEFKALYAELVGVLEAKTLDSAEVEGGDLDAYDRQKCEALLAFADGLEAFERGNTDGDTIERLIRRVELWTLKVIAVTERPHALPLPRVLLFYVWHFGEDSVHVRELYQAMRFAGFNRAEVLVLRALGAAARAERGLSAVFEMLEAAGFRAEMDGREATDVLTRFARLVEGDAPEDWGRKVERGGWGGNAA